MVTLYKTYRDFDNESGIYQILYPVRDSIPVINPFLVILLGFWMVAIVASYYTYLSISGKGRLFNSILASSFVTTIVSIYFAMAVLIDPYSVLLFIGLTIVSFALVIFYR